MNRGHLRESYRVLREQPILVDRGSGFFFAHARVVRRGAQGYRGGGLSQLAEGPDVGPMSGPLPWWAGQGDTSSIHAFIERAVAAPRREQ